MLLAVDIGNTVAAAVLFRGRAIVARARTATPRSWSARALSALLAPARRGPTDAAIVSSVVPRLDRGLAAALRRQWGLEAVFLDAGTRTGLPLCIDRPEELGADRIADCLGALALFPPPLIVIDAGTAVTFDLVDRRGRYRGGCILPGIGISIQALAEHAARLEPVAFAVPRRPVGRNTADSIRAGVFHGQVGALQHLIALYRRELGPGVRVVATGGMLARAGRGGAAPLRGRLRGIDAYAPDLIFHGLRLIQERLQEMGA